METVTIKLETYNRLKDNLKASLESYYFIDNVYRGKIFSSDKEFIKDDLIQEIKHLREVNRKQFTELSVYRFKEQRKSFLQRLFG